ncbi:MAG: hypothetical protein J6C89_01965, partial [Clostridia bacterium]|nr:hypothetical protein [Clostridia bacterium]
FIAGYKKSVSMGEMATEMNGRVLMNLMSDGTLELFVALDAMGSLQTAKYTGTYTLGENDEFDETITFTYQYGQTEADSATVTDAVILDGVFASSFHMITAMTSSEIEFYETAPVAVEGDIYVGFMQKESGMGKMTYSYALAIKEDGTFKVSIMLMAPAMSMHSWGATEGTYVVDGENITFTYDVLSDDGEIVCEDFVSEGTGYSENGLSVGFNISQASTKASATPFIRVK